MKFALMFVLLFGILFCFSAANRRSIRRSKRDVSSAKTLQEEDFNNLLKTTMANDFLVSKWRKWFSFFDHNKDGKATYSEMESARGNFTTLHHFEGEKKKKSNEAFTKWWVEYVLWGQEELTVDEFIDRQNAAFKAGKANFFERMHKLEEIICGFVDATGDGYISEEEILVILKADGYDDEEKDKKFFKEFNPKGSKVTVKEMIELWTNYLTSEDSTKPDPCKKGLQDIGL